MPYLNRIKAENSLDLMVDGKQIAIKRPSKRNAEINWDLRIPENWNDFVADPPEWLAKYDLTIDPELGDQLKVMLDGVASLDDLRAFLASDGCETCATVWAVASGSFSVASSKIAVAF